MPRFTNVAGIEPPSRNVCGDVAVIEHESDSESIRLYRLAGPMAWRSQWPRRARWRTASHRAHLCCSSNRRTFLRITAIAIVTRATEKDLSATSSEDFIAVRCRLVPRSLLRSNPVRTRGPAAINIAFAELCVGPGLYPYPVKSSIARCKCFTRRDSHRPQQPSYYNRCLDDEYYQPCNQRASLRFLRHYWSRNFSHQAGALRTAQLSELGGALSTPWRDHLRHLLGTPTT